MKIAPRNSKGAVMLIAAVFVPVFLALAALMVDFGLAFSAKNRIEYVAIQAVEAAEHKLPDGPLAQSIAESLATSMLEATLQYSESPVVTAFSDGSMVSVEIMVETKTFFAPIMGVGSVSVRAGASRPLP